MNLKTLIILKFFVILASISIYFYFSHTFLNHYNGIEERNKILLEQKTVYERILKIKSNDIEGRKNVYEIIKKQDSSLKLTNQIQTLNINDCLNLILMYYIINFMILSYLNKKIDLKKAEETESENENFL